MSIPLIQEATKDAINTSIIAIKRNIERINNLLGLSGSEEIDTSIFATKEELDALETALQPVDEVAVDNMQSVTSNAVAKRLENYLCTDRLMNLSKVDLAQFNAVAYIPINTILELKNMAGKRLVLEFGVYQYQASFDVQISWGTMPAVVQQATGVGRTSYVNINQVSSYAYIYTGLKFYNVTLDIPAGCDFVGIGSSAILFVINLSIL